MTDHEDLMKRCQRGATNLNDANNLLAECYGMLGKLGAENKALHRFASTLSGGDAEIAYAYEIIKKEFKACAPF